MVMSGLGLLIELLLIVTVPTVLFHWINTLLGKPFKTAQEIDSIYGVENGHNSETHQDTFIDSAMFLSLHNE